jgi:hypothetical protein
MNSKLAEGLTDAVGFLAGVALAYVLGRLVGFDPLAPGYDGASIGGLMLAGVGGGVGVQAARIWRKSRIRNTED